MGEASIGEIIEGKEKRIDLLVAERNRLRERLASAQAAREEAETKYKQESFDDVQALGEAEQLTERYRGALERIVKVGEAEVYAGSGATPIVGDRQPPNGYAMLELARTSLGKVE